MQTLWILQQLLIPTIQWSPLIYVCTVFIQKWLHLHHSISSLCFYYSVSPYPLPIKSLSSSLKTFKISGHLLLINSQDSLLSNCILKLQAGTWRVQDAILSCENNIKINQVCGNGNHIRHGLGYTITPKIPKNKSSKHYWKYISDHHKKTDDTYAFSAVQLQVHGQWTIWMNYVQQDFSWASLLATTANLTSFCHASTYDTLPSPTNMKWLRITPEAVWTLSSKDVCTTANILGASKVSLLQGRHTFRHDTVLHQVIEALKTFISNIKEAAPVSATSSITFVKKGAKVPGKRTPPVGILHYASHCVLLTDLNSNYSFLVHIAFTQLRPGITIFSNNLRKIILTELTCPCEENMESWHSTKINKYLALKTIRESNRWCVEVFAVEVGASGYCSNSIAFKKLGFNNTFIKNTIKTLSKSSTECSFCIWLARNNKDWTASAANCKLNDPSKETCNLPSSLSSLKQTIKPVSNTKSILPAGFINKGITCYINSILTILIVVPNLLNRVPSESNNLSPMLWAISLNSAVKKNSTKSVYPSNVSWALKRNLSFIRGVPFDVNTQQNVAEILQVVLDELKGISLEASHLICNRKNHSFL